MSKCTEMHRPSASHKLHIAILIIIMKVVGFLLALGIVSTNALSKSAKSSSRSGSGKSGKAEVFEEINAVSLNNMSCDNNNRRSIPTTHLVYATL